MVGLGLPRSVNAASSSLQISVLVIKVAITREEEIEMIYKVALHRSEEGYSVTVPGLPGCCSQGADEAEALDIADAIRDYLEVRGGIGRGGRGSRSRGHRLVMPRLPGVNHLDAVRALEKGRFSNPSASRVGWVSTPSFRQMLGRDPAYYTVEVP